MLFPKKQKQHYIDFYLLDILVRLMEQTEKLIFHQKQAEKKDLFDIIDDMLQDLPKQEYSNMDDIVLQEEFAFQRDLYAFFQDLGLKFPFPYIERKDKGIDFSFIYNNDVYVVQARTIKDTTKGISPCAIRELAGVQHIKPDKYIFITNTFFTADTKETANLANIYLIDAQKLKVLIRHKELLKAKIKKESM